MLRSLQKLLTEISPSEQSKEDNYKLSLPFTILRGKTTESQEISKR